MSLSLTALPARASLPRVSPRTLALGALLAVAAVTRLAVVATQTYVIFADETFQYLEQGHRLAFGSGVVPWEYHDGIRSWLLPGIVAVVMRMGAAISPDPAVYLGLIRGLCALLSLAVVWAGFTLGWRRGGMAAAMLTGGLCAIWFDLLYFAPTVLTEVLAAHLAVIGLLVVDDSAQRTPSRWAAAGALLGLAVMLRFQYGVPLALAALWQGRSSVRAIALMAVSGGAVVVAVGGLLDWVSWGSPFQSIWLNVLRNSRDGVSAAMGVEPASFVAEYAAVALWPAPLLLVLLLLGAPRAPALAIAGASAVLLHSLVPHKEVRFFYLAIAVAPILIGLGAAAMVDALAARRGPAVRRWGVPVLLALFALASWRNAETLGARWTSQQPQIRAFLMASRAPDLCGLGVADMYPTASGGYTYLHRNVPVLFDLFEPALSLAGARVPLRFSVVQAGSDLPQPQAGRLLTMTDRFNYLIADTAPGEYVPLHCESVFAPEAANPALCLYRRPGLCTPG